MTGSTRQPRTDTRAETKHLTESQYHELLSVELRRATLDVLAMSTGPIELADLAAMVAPRETAADETDEATVERVAIYLHHRDLPKMDDLEVIDYDQDAARVE